MVAAGGPRYEGLFGYSTGTIKNLTVSGSVEATGYAGIIAGYSGGTIENCICSGSVESTSDHGGVTGYNASGAVITESISSVAITGNGNAGGLSGSNYGTIQYSGATGKVTGGSNNTGGLVGYSQDGTITNCYARGAVTGTGNTGGLAGYVRGYSGASKVLYCYASGAVNSNAGAGLVGARGTYYSGSSTVILFSYYNSANTGNRYGIPASVAKLKTQSNYTGWDFEHVWTIADSYPSISINGESEAVEVSGAGESDDPYIITNEEQLLALAKGELPLEGKYYYKLANDITLTSSNWTPIGGNGFSTFQGVFDGGGYTISGLVINGCGYDDTGLFGSISSTSTIKNLTVIGDVEATSDAGLLVGQSAGTIEKCVAYGTVTSTGYAGGLVGNNTAAVTKSVSYAEVSGTNYCGVLAGCNTGTITLSLTEGSVTGTSSYTGGFAGYNSGTIENSYANSMVTSTNNNYAGGFVGRNTSAITNCYSLGVVNEGSGGGLIGYNSGTVTASYYCSTTSGSTDTGKGDALTRDEMEDETNFLDWDFSETWAIYETINSGLPFLIWEMEPTETDGRSFWYSAVESKKGYAVADQDMSIYLKDSTLDSGYTIEFDLTYVEDDEEKTVELYPEYSTANQRWEATFHIAEGMQEISSLKAIVLDTEEEISFVSSFWYQMPLKVEGLLTVHVSEDTAYNSVMSLKLFNASNRCIYTYKMDGETDLTIRSLSEGTYKVALYGNGLEFYSQDEVEVKQGSSQSVDFTSVPQIASISVEFYCDDVKLSDKNLEVNFFDLTEGKSRTLEKGTSVTPLAEGDTIGYSLYLNSTAKRQYFADSTVYEATLDAGENVVRIDVKKFSSISVTLTVKDETTGDPVYGASVSAIQVLNDTYSNQVSGTTDTNGCCTLKLTDVSADIVVTKKGFGTRRVTFTAEELLSAPEVELGALTGIVQFALSCSENLSESADESSRVLTSASKPSKIVLTRTSTDKSIELLLTDWPYVYEDGTGWEEGETFEAVITTSSYEPLTLTAEVNEFGNLYFTGILTKKGSLSVALSWDSDLSSGNNSIALFDADGTRVNYTTSKQTSVSISSLDAGTYTLAAADISVGLNKYKTLSELQEASTIADQWDYSEVTIRNGYIAEASMTIPIADSENQLIDSDESSMIANNSYARIGDTVTLRAQYVFNDNEDVTTKTAILSVPEGTRLIDSSVTVNGTAQEVTVDEDTGTFEVETTGDSLLVRYSVRVLTTVTVTELNFLGKASYELSGETVTELLGRATVVLNELTIVAPAKTNYTTLSVSGVAPKNAVVEIYDGDALIGQTTAGKYGSYKATVELVSRGKYTTHYLKAVTTEDGTEKVSETVEVLYGSRTSAVSSFSLTYNNGSRLTIANPTQGIGNMSISWNPSYPFVFEVHFEDNSAVTMVSVITTLKNGNTVETELTYNSAYDCYEGSVKLSSSQVATAFSVSYLPISYAAGDVSSSLAITSATAEAAYTAASGAVGKVSTLELDDAQHTAISSITEIETNVSFTPDATWYSSEVNGLTIWYTSEVEELTKDNVSYLGISWYVQLSDGSYAKCTKGVQSDQITSWTLPAEYELVQAFLEAIEESETSSWIALAEEYESVLEEAAAASYAATVAADCAAAAAVENSEYTDTTISTIAATVPAAVSAISGQLNTAATDSVNETYSSIFSVSGMTSYLSSNQTAVGAVIKPPSEYEDSSNKEESDMIYINTSVDPSGFVYETFEDNPIEGVTAELYFENDEGNMQFWDAEEYNQENPLLTDAEGKYGWDVPEGIWQVIYKKDGYEIARSEKMEVPPPQLDVNIEMVSDQEAVISGQTLKNNRLTIEFSKYLQKDSLGAGSITVLDSDGKEVSVTMEFSGDAVRSYNDIDVVKTVDLVADGYLAAGTYTVVVSKGLQTYYGTVCSQMTTQFEVVKGADSETTYTVTIPENVVVEKNGTALADGDAVSTNDILTITAQTSEKLVLKSLTVNDTEFTSGGTFTVSGADVVIAAEFETILSTYTVDFDSRGGSLVDSQEIQEGGTVTKPENPTLEGIEFAGWYLDTGYQTKWNFETDVVTEDITLYAKWSEDGEETAQKQTQQFTGTNSYVKTLGDAAFKLDTASSAGAALTYASSDTSVATVSADGTVTLVAVGAATITVTAAETTEYQSATMNVTITIQAAASAEKQTQTITGTTSYTKTVGDAAFKLDAASSAGAALTYSSSNTSVATVSTDGTVTVAAAGTATITVTAAETTEYKSATMTVTITVQAASESGTSTDSSQGGSSADDSSSTGGNTSQSGSDSNQSGSTSGADTNQNSGAVDPATCSHSYGEWTVVKEATALTEGTRQAVCSICGTVKTETIPKLEAFVTLNVTENATIPLKVKQKTKAIKVMSYQTGDYVVSWTSSNKKVATVSSSGQIKGKKKGTTTITVTMASGVSASFKIKVQKTTVKAKKVTVASKKLTISKGKSVSLEYAVNPITCVQKVKFTSSNKKVATVSSKGVVKAKKAGKTKITIKIGTKKVVVTVTVKK